MGFLNELTTLLSGAVQREPGSAEKAAFALTTGAVVASAAAYEIYFRYSVLATLPPRLSPDTAMKVLRERGALRVDGRDSCDPIICFYRRGTLSQCFRRPLVLSYFSIQALGELPKLILEVAGWPYYAVHYHGDDNWRRFKPKLPFGRMPALHNFGGFDERLCQSLAINLYLGKITGLGGRNDFEDASLLSLWQQLSDFLNPDVWDLSELTNGIPPGHYPSIHEISRAGTHTVVQKMVSALRYLEGRVSSVGSKGYLLFSRLTIVDLRLFLVLMDMAEDDRIPDWGTRLGLPALWEYMKRLETHPRIAGYLDSGTQMPRLKPGSYTFTTGRRSVAFPSK
mmetsp:Transcript_13624/g.44840  ORF Transcript_13624/g.44840 Transcript_13624/m.44840 type:complete len:339 (+) Transcript_13624:16-1032(+)